MKYLYILLFCLPLMAQDAVNPCAVDTQTLDCSAPDGPAEAEFRQIKLNGGRNDSPTIAAGEDLVLSATLKFTKRARAVVTTTFTGSGSSTCPDRVEEQRLKPELDIAYSADLTVTGTTTHYSGTGLEFTVPGSALAGASSALLTVTFTVTGSSAPGCLATPYPNMTKVFTLLVDDGSFYGEITAENDDEADDTDYSDAKRMPVVVAEHSYFLVNQDRKLKFTASFATLGGAAAADDEIHWSITPASAGTFTHGATGKTVKFRQGTYQSLALDDVVVRAEGPSGANVEFKLSYISVDPLEVQMSTGETRQFVVPEAYIHPTTADKSIIVGLLGQPEIVGNKFNGVRLRTRQHTGLALASESFVPSETLQWAHTSRVLERGTYLHIANTLVLEVTSSNDEGTYNLSWEIKRLFHSERRYLHHAVVQVQNVPLPTTLTLVKDGTSDTGPFNMGLDGAQLHVRALTSGGTFAAGFPTWAILAPAGSAIAAPPAGTNNALFAFDKPGTYTFTVTENGQTDDLVVQVYGIDLDVDSDNDNGLANPAGSAGEDLVENSSPGKILIAGTGDADGDQVPDYADGYNFDASGAALAADNASTHNLVPVVLRLPEPIDPSVARLHIDYDSSDPMFAVTTDSDPLLPIYLVSYGSLRLWRKDGNQVRNGDSSPAGDFIEGGTYTAADLGFSATVREVVFYLESVRGSTTWGDLTLEVKLDYDGTGPAPYIHTDTLVFSSVFLKVSPRALLQTGVAQTLTASAQPAGGSFDWALTQGAARATVTGPTNTPTLQITANQYSDNVGDITATVAYTAPVPGGTPATVVQLAVPLPAFRIGTIRDDGDANVDDDPFLTYLDISNERTTLKMGAGDGHTDNDNFKIQISGPYPAATIPATAVSLEALKPDGTGFATARTLTKAVTRIVGTSHFRSDYLRLVVDSVDQTSMPTQTLMIDWDATDDTVEILGQQVKLRLATAAGFEISKKVPVGHNVRTLQLAAHWITGSAGVSSASVRKRIYRDLRRMYAQVNLRPILNSVTEVAPPHNFIAIADDNGNHATGGGTFGIQVVADRGVGGLVTWNASAVSVAGRTAYQTAGQLETALESVAPTSGGNPADRLVVTRYQNNALWAMDAIYKTADLLIQDPAGGTVTLVITANTDAAQKIEAPPVTKAMIGSEPLAALIGSIEQRSLIRNYDTSNGVFDLYVAESLSVVGTGQTLMGQARMWGSDLPAHHQGIDPIKNNAFFANGCMTSGTAHPNTVAHELGHCLNDAGHATLNPEQVMKDTTANDLLIESGSKRFADRLITFDGQHGYGAPSASFNQVTRMRAHSLTSAKQKQGELEPEPDEREWPSAAPAVASVDTDQVGGDELLEVLLDHPQSFNQVRRQLVKLGDGASLGTQIMRLLGEAPSDERLSRIFMLAAQLELRELEDAIWAIVENPETSMTLRLLGLRSLLRLGDEKKADEKVTALIQELDGYDHLQRLCLLRLTCDQRPLSARTSLVAIRDRAAAKLAELEGPGLVREALAELGSWGDIHNQAQRALMDLDQIQARATGGAQALVELYLERWPDSSLRLRVLAETQQRGARAAVLALARQRQHGADEGTQLRLLSLRDALQDELDDAELGLLNKVPHE